MTKMALRCESATWPRLKLSTLRSLPRLSSPAFSMRNTRPADRDTTHSLLLSSVSLYSGSHPSKLSRHIGHENSAAFFKHCSRHSRYERTASP